MSPPPLIAPTLLADAEALARLCEQLAPYAFVGVDTEFMRTDTYYARLCLLQLAPGDEHTVCVDTLDIDVRPLLDALYLPSRVLVLHAGRQDLELFADLRGAPPRRVFDTQIAAGLAGFDEQIGYGALVAALTGYTPAKLHTRTDWSRRPLPSEALHYAEEDVRFLPRLHHELAQRLQTLGRQAWAEEEFSALTDPALYRNDPAHSYERISAGRTLPVRAQPILRELAAWREHTAQRLNRPRGWIASDALLVAIARRAPGTREALAGIEGMPPALARKHAAPLLDAIELGKGAPEELLWPPTRAMSGSEMNCLKRLQAHTRRVATELGIAPSLLANRRELAALAQGGEAGRLQRGWRWELLGQALVALREN